MKITNASGHVDYQAVYDSMGKATEVTNAAGSKTTNVYDWAGNLTKQTDALGNSSSYTYNNAGQMVSAVDKLGGISYTTYDGMGNITSMTDPGTSAKVYVYDSAGRRVESKTVSDEKTTYTYNAAGLLTEKNDSVYRKHTYTYDAAGRILSEEHLQIGHSTPMTVTYTYDANGNVLTVTDSEGTVTREYDALNRVSKYTDVYGNVIEYEYNECGMLSEMTYPTGDTGIYTYDANHNMVKSTLGDGIETEYEYNAQNQVKKVTKPDGSTEGKSYDSAGRLQIYNNRTKSGRTFTVYIYMYDALGRITSELEAITMTEYAMTYDSLGWLVKRVERRYGTSNIYNTEDFTYDAAGNILTGGTEENSDTYGYAGYNRLSTINDGWVYSDYAGNITFCYLNNIAIDLRYDEKNRLQDLTHGYGSYSYDAENNRIYADGTKYVYDTSDGRNRLAESIDGDGNITLYGYGAEGLVWSKCGDELTVCHYDYRGSVIAVTDKDGNITDTLKYDAYGSTVDHKGSSTLLFGYNGQYGVQTDKSGYLYMRTRYYSPEFKRFLSADVIDGSIADSTSLNLYTYVNGNPISFVDPFGLEAKRGQNNSSSFGMPTALEAAYMASHIYNATYDAANKNLGAEFNGWTYVYGYSNGKGLVIGLYKRTIDGVTSYAVVNKGTTVTLIDNFQQPLGFSDDMQDSIDFARDVVTAFPDASITFIGHSKGGAEAAANAIATNQNAIIFNPATLAANAYDLNVDEYTAQMTAYIVEGEALNLIFGIVSSPIGNIEYLPRQSSGAIDNHSIASVSSALEGNKPPLISTLPIIIG